MYMLDTSICIYIKKNNPPQVLAKLQSLSIEQVCMSSVTYAELFYGAVKSQQSAKNIELISALKSAIPILTFDEAAAEQYGKIRADLEKRGLIIGSNDLLIAAHALSLNHILVSNNLREFNRVSGLSTENWL
jgi:tRNA(fMet)-specific endonuclease VapC